MRALLSSHSSSRRHAACRFGSGSGPAIAMLCIVVMLVTAPRVDGGTYHSNANMRCTDCHTQHASAHTVTGTPINTPASGGSRGEMWSDGVARPYLLRTGAATELCLSCHNGAASAPDVVNSYTAKHPAGSFPSSYTAMSNLAHTISASPVSPPDNPSLSIPLTCTTCHDPHGNGNYRNLRPDPTRTGKTPATVTVNQTVLPGSGAAISAIYTHSNLVYKTGISTWCTKCHAPPEPGSDHPDNVTMWGSTIASYARWSTTTYPRVPVDSPTDNTIPSNDDRVTCLSCHYTHGGENYKFLRYNNDTEVQTCGECHDQ